MNKHGHRHSPAQGALMAVDESDGIDHAAHGLPMVEPLAAA